MCPARRCSDSALQLWGGSTPPRPLVRRQSASPVLPAGPEDLPSTAASPEKSTTQATSFVSNPYPGLPSAYLPALPDNQQRIQQWLDLLPASESPTPCTTDQITFSVDQENLPSESTPRFPNLASQLNEFPSYQDTFAVTSFDGNFAYENMPAQSFEEWAASSICTYDFEDPRVQEKLKDSVIGVDASYYLDLRLNKTSHEPLLHALGGFPYSLKKILDDDIQLLRSYQIEPIFVFDGLDFRNKEPPSSRSLANRRAHEDGWKHYSDGDPDQTVADFSRAACPVETLHKYLQKLLSDFQITWMVAPYSAMAQLYYLQNEQDKIFLEYIMGSLDCFLFDINKILVDFDVKTKKSDWISKSGDHGLKKRLGNVSDNVFRDAQLLLGSPFLPTFPILNQDSPTKSNDIREALALLNSAGQSVPQLCYQFRNDPNVIQLQYSDRYKKAIMTIRHHAISGVEGKIRPLHPDDIPGDVHEFVGRQLPDELYYYIQRGVMGTRVPNWLASDEIVLDLPGGCADSDTYQKLMRDQLNGLRAQSLSLLPEFLHRYHQKRVIALKMWYNDDTSDRNIDLKESQSIKSQIASWKIHEEDFPVALRNPQNERTLLSALRALKDSAFLPKATSKPPNSVLRTTDEIIYNVLWRFLQLRGFVNEKHELTSWGVALEAAISALDSADKMEEYVFVAIEMLRMGLVNGKDMTKIPGGAEYGTDSVKLMTNLVSRIACFGRLKHRAVGYSGPLDRQLLSYSYMITAVRSSLRDLIETILVSMFLSYDAERDRKEYFDLVAGLPFINDNGCGLAIATRTYLDAINKDGNQPTDKLKGQIKAQEEPYIWFQFVSNLSKNLDNAFKLWDAVYAGVQEAGKEIKDLKTFSETNDWLHTRR